jgi:hypothetical protein
MKTSDALRRHCADLSRPYESVLRSHITMPLVLAESAASLEAKLERMGEASQPGLFAGTPAQATAFYRKLVAAGMRYFIVAVRVYDYETLHLLGEQVVPEFASDDTALAG